MGEAGKAAQAFLEIKVSLLAGGALGSCGAPEPRGAACARASAEGRL